MDAPRLCHHLGNEFTFPMQDTPYSLRGAVWPGAFPAMWSRRCFWWFELESLLETSQVPKPQRSPWNGCNVCWVPEEIQKGLAVSQVSEAAIFSLLSQFSNITSEKPTLPLQVQPWKYSPGCCFPWGRQDRMRECPQHLSQLKGREVSALGSQNVRTWLEKHRERST